MEHISSPIPHRGLTLLLGLLLLLSGACRSVHHKENAPGKRGGGSGEGAETIGSAEAKTDTAASPAQGPSYAEWIPLGTDRTGDTETESGKPPAPSKAAQQRGQLPRKVQTKEQPGDPATTSGDKAEKLTREVLQTKEYAKYKLGPGDVIELFTTEIEEINREYVIGPDGSLSLPIVGVVRLKGLTREEASERIEEKLSRLYHNPEVDVLVQEYNNNRVYVLGEVRKPGEFNFTSRPTLLSALSRAEGLSRDADMRECTIVRGNATLITVNLYNLLRKGNSELNIPLQPEDTVFVKNNAGNMFFTLGEVRRPGAYARTREVDIVRAIAMAGGFTENAVQISVRVIRREEDNTKELKADLQAAVHGNPGEKLQIATGDIE